jgi:hypothetical protein
MKKLTNPRSVQVRQADFKAKQKKAGLVRVEVWVPESKKAALLEFIESLKGDQ